MKRVTALWLAVAATWAQQAGAETIWHKARYGDRSESLALQYSVERVLMGSGEERDLLNARVGLITLSRGEIDNPRTLIMLLRLRREMGLSQAAQGERQLAEALAGPLSLTERAWARIERAHFHLAQSDLPGARRELDAGMDVAWQASLRAELLILRGLVAVRAHEGEAALVDFQSVYLMDAPRRQVVQAHIGEAMAHALRGDVDGIDKSSRRAFVVESNRATVSRADPFWDLGLSSPESAAVRALLLWGQAQTLEGAAPANAQATRLQACGLTRAGIPDEAEGKGPRDALSRAAWGTLTLRTLGALWELPCSRPIPPEVAVSAPGDDEDDL